MDQGLAFIRTSLEEAEAGNVKVSEGLLRANLKVFMQAEFPAISARNLTSIYSQGLYYSWKDGLDNNLE